VLLKDVVLHFTRFDFSCSTGEDNAEAPCLPKTPSTSRRLRGRQPRTRKKPTDDGSPVLTRTLRKTKRSDQQKDGVDDSEPLQDIGNNTTMKKSPVKADENFESSFRKSSRRCAAVRASQAIVEQSTVKKNVRKNAKRTDSTSSSNFGAVSSPAADMLSKVEVLDSTKNSNLLTSNTVKTSQQNPTSVSNLDDSPELEAVLFLQGKITCNNSPELTPPALHYQSTKEIDQLSIIDVDDELTPLVAHSSSCVNHHVSPIKHCFSPIKEVMPTTTVMPNADRLRVENAAQFSTKPESVCKDEFFTPPDKVNSTIDVKNHISTVSGQSYSPLDTPEVICDSCTGTSDLARLTKLASSQLETPVTVTKNSSTPVTIIKNSSTLATIIKSNSSPTAISQSSLTPATDTQTSSSIETPVTVTKQSLPNHISATVTKVKHSVNPPRKAADGSPELLTSVKRPQESQVSSTLSGTTKKQKVTPNSCFSPARPKVS